MKLTDSYIKILLSESINEKYRMSFDITLPEDILILNKVFNKSGFELYIVGGSIRDALVGKPPKDWDLATNANPTQIINILKQIPIVINIIETGKAFGVVNALTKNDEYEIATFREDGTSSDNRRPDSVIFSNIETDALRRDLTINALYYDITTHEIIDFVGGIDDIKNGVVRTVGDANTRFGEDRLRILRAIRFAGRFNTSLSNDIKNSLKNDNNLKGVSQERIRDEFIKTIKTSKSVGHSISLYNEFNIFPYIFPNLKINLSDIIETHDYILVIATLLKNNITDNMSKQLNGLKYPTVEALSVMFLINLQKVNADDIKIFKTKLSKTNLSNKQVLEYSRFNNLDINLINKMLEYNLQITSKDAIDKGITPGPEMGDAIKSMEIESFKSYLNHGA